MIACLAMLVIDPAFANPAFTSMMGKVFKGRKAEADAVAPITAPEDDLTLTLVLVSLSCAFLLYIASWRTLPAVRVGLREVLTYYKPGKFYDWHLTMARAAGLRCWTIKLPHDPRIFGTVDPKVVEHVLVDPVAYEKGEQWRTAFMDVLGDGIFNADGDSWRQQRKVAAHEFSVRSLRTFMTSVFRERQEAVVRLVEASADAGGSLDVQELFARYTLDSIGQIGFGVEIDCLDDGAVASSFSQSFDTATKRAGARFVDPLWQLKRWFNVGEERALRHALNGLRAFSKTVIAARRAVDNDNLEARPDLLSRFLLKGYDDAQLHDTIINFVLAGRDTTAILLTWTFFELARHPEVVAKLRAEAQTVRADAAAADAEDAEWVDAAAEGSTGAAVAPPYPNKAEAGAASAPASTKPRPTSSRLEADGGLGYHAIKTMPYLKAVLTEVLRLHPSVPLDFKTATKRDVLPDGTVIRKGERVMFVAYAMARMPSLWDEPERFNPSRHIDPTTSNFITPPPYAFPVFLAGPRTCLGKDMAYLGAGLLLTSLLDRFDIALDQPAAEVTYDIGLTLWTKDGVRVAFRRRPPAGAESMLGSLVRI